MSDLSFKKTLINIIQHRLLKKWDFSELNAQSVDTFFGVKIRLLLFVVIQSIFSINLAAKDNIHLLVKDVELD